MVAEVCSIYVHARRRGAGAVRHQGLKQEAVHKTRLRGRRRPGRRHRRHARPLALADAQRHPQFRLPPGNRRGDLPLADGRADPARRPRARRARRPEPHPPAIHRGRDRDAADRRHGAGRAGRRAASWSARTSCAPATASALLPLRLDGVTPERRASRIGGAVLHQPRFATAAAGRRGSRARSSSACAAALDGDAAARSTTMLSAGDIAGPASIARCWRPIACSPRTSGWLSRIDARRSQTGLTAEAAVQKVQDDTRARMREVTDPYLRERLADLEDLANRLLRHLLGADMPTLRRPAGRRDPGGAQHGPGRAARLRPRAAQGRWCWRRARRTPHVAIVARALDIPVVGRCQGPDAAGRAGDPLVVDGDNAQLFIRPADDIRADLRRKHAPAPGEARRPMPRSAICRR